MRAVLPNCRSLPDARGYPSPLQLPPFHLLSQIVAGHFLAPSFLWVDAMSTSSSFPRGCSIQAMPQPLSPAPAPTLVSNQAGHSSTQGAPSWQTQHSTAPILEPQIQQIYKISTEANLHNLEDPQMFAQMQVVKRFWIIPLHAPLSLQAHSQTTFLIVCLAGNREMTWSMNEPLQRAAHISGDIWRRFVQNMVFLHGNNFHVFKHKPAPLLGTKLGRKLMNSKNYCDYQKNSWSRSTLLLIFSTAYKLKYYLVVKRTQISQNSL